MVNRQAVKSVQIKASAWSPEKLDSLSDMCMMVRMPCPGCITLLLPVATQSNKRQEAIACSCEAVCVQCYRDCVEHHTDSVRATCDGV